MQRGLDFRNSSIMDCTNRIRINMSMLTLTNQQCQNCQNAKLILDNQHVPMKSVRLHPLKYKPVNNKTWKNLKYVQKFLKEE